MTPPMYAVFRVAYTKHDVFNVYKFLIYHSFFHFVIYRKNRVFAIYITRSNN